ncbi:hypothetical protein MC885_016224 [Smutsia gigantea]|nr:hypothetical protein MC885_016224 [Smutsia gigantea]
MWSGAGGQGPVPQAPAGAAKPASQRINRAERPAFLQADARRSQTDPQCISLTLPPRLLELPDFHLSFLRSLDHSLRPQPPPSSSSHRAMAPGPLAQR